jgi:phosphopantothenoylcysteine decarboxylase/phosphopantothenate--cysteine ligase
MSHLLVLGVSGSVAAYRAADLARELMRAGFTVRVCLTDSAQKFVSPALFEALTGQPCLTDVFDEPIAGRMAHIDWARDAEAVVVAPATANVMAKLAAGIADDMLTTIAVATTRPLLIAPAMNPTMYASDAVQAALRTLQARAVDVIEPESGDVACGENGQGKFPSIVRIVERVVAVTGRSRLLEGQTVLITSGPTEEPIDVARYLSNRSSGKMGSAIARAVHLLGGHAVVIAGPQEAPLPLTAEVRRVRTAEEMLAAALAEVSRADWVIGAAAVADYRPRVADSGKLRRANDDLTLDLVPNPDIIGQLATRTSKRVVGFAAEPTPDLSIARDKLARKGLFAVVANDVSRDDAGFGVDTNEVEIVFRSGRTARSPHASKLAVALWLLEALLAESKHESSVA